MVSVIQEAFRTCTPREPNFVLCISSSRYGATRCWDVSVTGFISPSVVSGILVHGLSDTGPSVVSMQHSHPGARTRDGGNWQHVTWTPACCQGPGVVGSKAHSGWRTPVQEGAGTPLWVNRVSAVLLWRALQTVRQQAWASAFGMGS